MTLYADVLFAINFSMDFLSIFITGKVLHKKIYKSRILLSSIIGGVYGVLELLIQINIFIGAITNVFVSLIMCLVAFKESKITKYTGILVLFWGISATLGGVMSLFYRFLNELFFKYIENYSYDNVYNGARFFIVLSLTMLFSMIFWKMFNNKKSTKEVDLKVMMKNKSYHLKGLCDSGNVLFEPITGKSVILVSSVSDIGKMIELESDIKKRYIPFCSVDKKGMLRGIVPDKLLINNSEISAIIAPAENKSFNGFDALVPLSLV